MAGIRWLETDTLFNQNISSALAVGIYTGTADGQIFCDVLLNGVAGNGDYVIYMSKIVSGLEYVILPKTTQTAASGETRIGGQTIGTLVRSGDVLKTYVDGLAGDTSVSGTVVRWYEDASLISTTDIADQVWDELLAGHVIAGSAGATLTTAGSAGGATPASLWAYTSRTLTQSAAQVIAALSGSLVTIQRGDTFTLVMTGLGVLTGYVSIDFTVKVDPEDTDDNALLRVRKNATGIGDGLLRLNGASTTTSWGTITIDDAALGNITIAISFNATKELAVMDDLYYDIQKITATTVNTLTNGSCTISADITKAVS